MRQREGIELAKKEGKFKGRLKKYHKNHAGMNYAVKLYGVLPTKRAKHTLSKFRNEKSRYFLR